MATRPTIGELKRCLRADHKCVITAVPLFPGNDNADGPLLEKIVNVQSDKSVPIEGLDDEEASPSFVEYICRRLGLDVKDVHLSCSGGPVSVQTPTAPVVPVKMREPN